jgi:hypothetical protein
MIRVYLLPVELDNTTNTERVKGAEYVRDAIIESTDKPNIRKLIQDTTDSEHARLIAVADGWREATQDEVAQLNQFKAQLPDMPPRDIIKEIDDLKARMEKIEKRITQSL